MENNMKITVKDIINELVELDRLIWSGEKKQASNEIHAIHEGLKDVVRQEHGAVSETNCENPVFKAEE